MEYRLEELFDLQMGKTPSRSVTEYWESGNNKWISIADLSKCGKYIYDTKECLSDIAVSESGIKQIPANTVVMSFKLSIGKTAITSEPMYSNEAIMSFRDRKLVQLLPEYIYYLLLSKNWDDGTNKAVMGKTLNKATLSKVKVNIHSMQEQQEIVYVLNQATALIELHQQQLQKLDELIKARFVEMFGDESNPYNFPIVSIEDVASVQVGVVIKPAQYYTDADHGIKTFRSLNIGPMHIKDTDWVYFSEEGNRKNQKSVLNENDLVIVRSGAPGTACVITKEYAGCNAVDIIIARPDLGKVNPYYLCQYTNLPHGKKQIEEGTGGAAQQHFNVGKYNKIRLTLPPLDQQLKFEKFVEQTDKSKVAVQKSLDEAQLLFDSLMQQYFG